MFKGFLLLLAFSMGSTSYADIASTPDVKAFAKMEKRIDNASRKERIELLSHLYKFMINREATQPMKITLNDPEQIDLLEGILWETAEARRFAADDDKDCVDKPAIRAGGRTYPASCMFAGNIICTRTDGEKPRCSRKFIGQVRPDLLCGKGGIKCQPDVFMVCDGSNRISDQCADVNQLIKADPRAPNGPQVTLHCVGGRDDAALEAKAKEVEKCADPAGIRRVIDNTKRFCDSLSARTKRSDDKSEFAGNDTDCADLQRYLDKFFKKPEGDKDNKTVTEAEPCEENDKQKMLCSGQDLNKLCGEITYTTSAEKVDGCLALKIEQKSSGMVDNTRVCKDSNKPTTDLTIAGSRENPGRGTNLLHYPSRNFSWKDKTKIGRVESKSEQGNPEFKNSLTSKKGYSDLCFTVENGVPGWRPTSHLKDYVDKIVKTDGQRRAIEDTFNKCAERNYQEMKRQGKDLKSARSVEEATLMYTQARNIWAMVKVDDVTNTHMATRVTSGKSKDGKAVCSPEKPCTDGTFICAKTNYSLEFKGDVAEFFTLYTDKGDFKNPGDIQMMETGTYAKPDLDSAGNQKAERDGHPKEKFLKYPVTRNYYDELGDEPWIELHSPVELKIGRLATLGIDRREQVAYSGTEKLCPQSVSSVRPHNRVMAKFDASNSIERIYICDSRDANNFKPWMEFTNLGSRADSNTTTFLKGMTGWNNGRFTSQKLDISFDSSNPLGSCIVKDSESQYPVVLAAGEAVKVRPGIRTIQSTGKPEPKKQ